uniref:F11 receptor n=1 Tax=Cercocebus atys TaxID=9531 RepID=A0A2K5LIR8_CERAT
MGTKAQADRKLLHLFILAILLLHSSEPEVRIFFFFFFFLGAVEGGSGGCEASYEDRVTFLPSGITFKSVTREDTGIFFFFFFFLGGNNYGEVKVKLFFFFFFFFSSGWAWNGIVMPTNPKSTRAFSNSSYVLNPTTGSQFVFLPQVFDPLSASDTGEYSCEARNGYGTFFFFFFFFLEAVERNVGVIFFFFFFFLILLGILIFGIWFAYSRGHFDSKYLTSSKKVIYSQFFFFFFFFLPGEFKQTSSFL